LISLEPDARALQIKPGAAEEFGGLVSFVHSPFSKMRRHVHGLGIAKRGRGLARLGRSSMRWTAGAGLLRFGKRAEDLRMSMGKWQKTTLSRRAWTRWWRRHWRNCSIGSGRLDSRRTPGHIVMAACADTAHLALGWWQACEAMGKVETASRQQNVSGDADSGESRAGGLAAVSFSDPATFTFRRLMGDVTYTRREDAR